MGIHINETTDSKIHIYRKNHLYQLYEQQMQIILGIPYFCYSERTMFSFVEIFYSNRRIPRVHFPWIPSLLLLVSILSPLPNCISLYHYRQDWITLDNSVKLRTDVALSFSNRNPYISRNTHSVIFFPILDTPISLQISISSSFPIWILLYHYRYAFHYTFKKGYLYITNGHPIFSTWIRLYQYR